MAQSMFGYGVSVGEYQVNDPDGQTQPTSDDSIVHILYMNQMSRDKRWYAEYYQITVEYEAQANYIGQEVKTKGVNLAFQKRFSFTRSIRPWFGFGVNLTSNEFTKRHTVDEDGYLVQSYDDRSDETLSLLIDAAFDIDLTDDLSLDVRLQHTEPFSDSVISNTITFILFYDI